MKSFLRQFFPLYIVFVLHYTTTLCVNLADNMMLGFYSEPALAAASAVNQVQFIYQQVLTALGDGIVMLGSQYWGQGRSEPIYRLSGVALRTGLGVALILFACMALFPAQIMGIFTPDGTIAALGIEYITIIKYTVIPFALIMLLLSTLRSMEIVNIAFYLALISLATNIFFNYLLIYGNFGAPQLGIQGAAISTLLARLFGLTLLLVFIVRGKKMPTERFKTLLGFDRLLARDYFRIIRPMLGIAIIWGVSTALQTVVMGHLSAEAMAANSVASVLFLMLKSACVGGSSTATIMIGKGIGQGDAATVRKTSVRLQQTFFVIALLGGLALFLLRIPVLKIYQLSPETHELANQFLIILSVVFVGMGYQMPTLDGIVRGGGNPGYVMKLNLISIWGIVLPISFLAAFYFGAPPAVVVICLNADQIFKCVPAFFKTNYGNWMTKLTRRDEDYDEINPETTL